MSKRSTQLSHGVLKASSGTATQLLFCESNLLCHYIVCRYAAVLFYRVDLGRSWKAHKLESNWFPAEPLLLPSPLCSPGESLWDFVREEKENAVVSWCKSNITPNQGLHPSVFLTCSFFPARTVYKHTSSCVHISCPQLPPAVSHFSQFFVFSEILQRQTWTTLETGMINTCWTGKKHHLQTAQDHISGANSQLWNPKHFLIDIPPVAMLPQSVLKASQ